MDKPKETILTLGQIEAISEFFEGIEDPAAHVTILEMGNVQEVVYFSLGTEFYKCDRMSPRKWRVAGFAASDTRSAL